MAKQLNLSTVRLLGAASVGGFAARMKLGSPPPDPRRLRRKCEAGGRPPRPPLELGPKPSWGLRPQNPGGAPPSPQKKTPLAGDTTPRPPPVRGLGRSNIQQQHSCIHSTFPQQHSCGEPPGSGGGAPGVWGQSHQENSVSLSCFGI